MGVHTVTQPVTRRIAIVFWGILLLTLLAWGALMMKNSIESNLGAHNETETWSDLFYGYNFNNVTMTFPRNAIVTISFGDVKGRMYVENDTIVLEGIKVK